MKKILVIISLTLCKFSFAQWQTSGSNIYTTTSNIGIGTATPISQLHLSSDNNHAFSMTRGNGSFGFRILRNATEGNIYFQIGSGLNTWETKIKIGEGEGPNTKLLLNPDGGNVGIGTTSPNSKLEVAGDIRQSGRTTYLYGANSNENQALMFAGWGVAHGGIYWRGDSRTFTLNTGDYADNPGQYGNANLVVTGNVGIGTTNINDASYKLYVETGIRTRKVKVDQAVWSDYVFHPNYSLRSLSEVEQYIQQHHHLPEVPSAAEVEKNGLDLGDNQAVLLKKIEELTLYIIEQHKTAEQMKTMISDLRKEVQEIREQKNK